ncbi:[protein-PII] uridylyltransferase [Lacimicrobium alkaliphilum]|uniref:Bifunctional uridylyltransferase/uridylyl-removing enzyme n=1 Tax=Lacimicrobium alkaliphilum TaxID=1526571 RepID=A0A0U3A9S7_9ALTE|nr:[protein-PII] uridylyltransferase [Lacimicrobium alkaliphilum]ALS97758.1 bifunctional uridylyltransferase/uridylyl-removing protein [Lacimicrobium alkaliphilum]
MSLQSLLGQIKRISTVDNIAAFKACIENNHQWLEDNASLTEVDNLVRGRATFVDALLRHIWQLLELHSYPELALVAVGGYGRGQLQPYSDIDLLLLNHKKPSEEINEKLGRFVTLLWDIGLDVGHSVRTLSQTIKLAKDDVSIATNLIEARLLSGSKETFNRLQQKVQGKGFWSSKDFFLAKYDEQRQRHAKFNGTAYNLEPNVKENPGCLRDIQTIGWVAKKHFKVLKGQELVEHNYFTAREFEELIECRNHLWRIRFALHLEAGRSENRLLFDFQPEVAKRLGYGDEGKASVETMMKAFFRTVRRISELNEMLLQHFRQDILAAKVRRFEPINQDFALADGLLQARHDQVFDTPEKLLSFLVLLSDTPQAQGLHSATLRLLRNARRNFRSAFLCERPGCRELFMRLLKHPNFFSFAWEVAHKHGIMQAYLPEWNQIVGMMQFDLFHAYTVDEHTHRLIKHIYHYSQSEGARDFPRCHRIFQNLDKPELLYIAAIFHDIGKGRGGDHSKLGAEDLRAFCDTHGVGKKDKELVVWLVENHLLMSVTAQRRDIYDPDVINEFAGKIRNVNYLEHLYALTLADIRATNDNLWNDWKASLLRELYLMTKKALESGLECQIDLKAKVEEHQQEALNLLASMGKDDHQVQQFWDRLDWDYFVRFKPSQLVWHASVILGNESLAENQVIVEVSDDTSKAGTELILYGRDRASLFAQIASVLDSRNCSIHDAQIMSTQDGYVFDSFVILEDDGSRITSGSRRQSLKDAILAQLERPGSAHQNNRKMPRRMKQLNVPVKMRFFTNQANMTLLELEALDAPGLLATISQQFVICDLSLHMAKITTIGERAEDLFILTNSQGEALTNEQQVTLKKQLMSILNQQTQSETCQN